MLHLLRQRPHEVCQGVKLEPNLSAGFSMLSAGAKVTASFDQADLPLEVSDLVGARFIKALSASAATPDVILEGADDPQRPSRVSRRSPEEKHSDKIFIGRNHKSFDFLGYPTMAEDRTPMVRLYRFSSVLPL
jgi:hypothetical protein